MKLNRKSILTACAVPAAFFLAPSAQAQALDMYAGGIFLTAGSYCPEYTMETNGATLAIQQYQLLYAVIGNTYGGNISQMNFMLPKLAAPMPGMRYCIVVQGMYPMRP